MVAVKRYLAGTIIVALLPLFLIGCSASGGGLSDLRPSAGEIVPGSSGVGNAPGVLVVSYSLGKRSHVTATLDGPAKATILEADQDAGEHVVRFNGVVPSDEQIDGYTLVRRVVPDGDYTITLSVGDERKSVPLKVSGSTASPPTLENLVVHPDRISPNSDAVDDNAEVTFRTNETATLSVDLTGANGVSSVAMAPIKQGPGEQRAVVSGQNDVGDILPDGNYTVTVRAEDPAGNRIEARRPLAIEGGGEPSIAVTRVEITPTQIILGQAINVSITVKNTGKVPLRTQGPDRGYTYTTNDSYSSIENHQFTDKAGLWRVGVDWDGNSGGAGPYRYPFRWGFGKTLMPGEEVTTGGQIVILKQEKEMWFYTGVLQEGIRIVFDRLGRTGIQVSY